MPIWCEPGKKRGGEKKVLPPPCKPFTFIITLNSAKEFESKSYILVLYEQWSASKIDDMVKLNLDCFVLGLRHSQRCQHELAEIAVKKRVRWVRMSDQDSCMKI